MPTQFHVPVDCLQALGWSRILAALGERCTTEPGAEAARGLAFIEDDDRVRLELAYVGEAMRLLDVGGEIPVSGARDISATLRLTARGAIADSERLLEVADTARAIARVRRHLQAHADQVPALHAYAGDLPDVAILAEELSATFDRNGEVRDDASPELAAARKRLASLHQSTKERLERYIATQEVAEILQDSYYTQREDRYVVPVVSSFQGQMPGIIHGTSNTAQTVYIEPEAFITANNEIKVAEAQVDVELRKVLRERSEWIAEEATALEAGLRRLIALDLVMARARLGRDLEAHVPEVSGATDDAVLSLSQARNPHIVLAGEHCVPNDIRLEAGESFLVITGPNTGGKTVTLITLGLLALMTRAAMPIPVAPDSRMVLFESVFAVIGDAQDISKHLSTFSGHVAHLKELLGQVDDGALILLDEIIVGTEPEQGSALAIAVLEALASRGARGLVTTHYQRLKTLAYGDKRFANAAVGMDPVTHQPNFRLTVGEPGTSNPLEVASRLGLEQSIISRARDLAAGDEGLTEAVQALEAARREVQETRRELERQINEAKAEVNRMEILRAKLEKRADEEVRRLRQEAIAEAEAALAEIREQVRDLQRAQDARDVERRRKKVVAVQEEQQAKLDQTVRDQRASPPSGERSAAPKGPHDAGDLDPREVAAGRAVWVRSFGQPGEIVELRSATQALVAVGSMKTTMKIKDLGRLGGVPEPSSAPSPQQSGAKAPPSRGKPVRMSMDAEETPPVRTGDNSVDIRGTRRDEVEGLVVPLLDRAFQHNLEAVWIIHGHGTGALRDEVRTIIKSSPYVSQWRPGRRHEGGDGATIAWLHRDWD